MPLIQTHTHRHIHSAASTSAIIRLAINNRIVLGPRRGSPRLSNVIRFLLPSLNGFPHAIPFIPVLSFLYFTREHTALRKRCLKVERHAGEIISEYRTSKRPESKNFHPTFNLSAPFEAHSDTREPISTSFDSIESTKPSFLEPASGTFPSFRSAKQDFTIRVY